MTQGKILIVDDSLMNIELLEETLEPFKYEILSYANPLDALEKEAETKIDLAIIDVVMPNIDGFKFAEKFLELHPNTQIAYVSAHGENENKIKGYNLGSFVYIEKPFDIKTLRAQIQSILKLKHVQDELLKEKQKLDDIFEFTSNEIILTDTRFNIISQNNKILDKNKFNYTNFLKILEKSNSQEDFEEFENFILSDANHFQFRLIFDSSQYVKVTFSKTKSNNHHSGYIIIMEDMTEELEKQNMRSHFIEMLTHDLKTPVRAEERALKLLLDGSFGKLNPEQHEIVQELLNSSRFMLRMTDNVLTRYKIDSGDCHINKTSNSIKHSIQSCIEKLNYMFEAKNQTVKITTKLDEKNDDIFDFDKFEMHRVLMNIISNASEYSPKGSEIKINIIRKEKDIEIAVHDCGNGISKDILDSLMKEKISNTRRFKKVGSGLGIYISKKIIEAHNGRININTDTTSGKGTTFTISLPFTKSQKPSLMLS